MIKIEFSFETVDELNDFLSKLDGDSPVVDEVSKPQEQEIDLSYGLDDISKYAVKLLDADKQPELLELLGEFNVRAVTELEPYQYYGFMTRLQAIEVGA